MDSDGPIERRSIYEGKVLRLSVDRVRLPDGEECELEMLRHPGAAAVVPVLDDGDVLLVRQFRYAAGGWLLEVPAGKLDPGETPEQCAVREVEEETGYRPGELRPLGAIFTAPGFTDERIWLFLGRQLKKGRQKLSWNELIRVERLPLREAVDLATSGAIEDAKSICALLRAVRSKATGT